MPRISFQDVADQLRHVDDPDVLAKVQGNMALSIALDMSRPVNWRGTGLTPRDILPVARDSGIPIAWVPPPYVLCLLVSAEPANRMTVLRAHAADILVQCGSLVTECRDGWLGDDPLLVRRAIDAFKAGHHEAAMALAVAVGESLARWASEERVYMFASEADKRTWERERKEAREDKSKYTLAKWELAAVGTRQDLDRVEVLRHALIGPVPKFFAPYRGMPGEEIPDTASRHATVHHPTAAHLTPENALLAIMLCISILREQQAWCEERDAEWANAQD
jgi:hypothetical protein